MTTCEPDPQRLAVFQDCLETYGMESNAPDSEWPWNVISRRAVAYECGQIAREGDPIDHAHDPAEVALCQRLAAAAEKTMQGSDVGMGSESGDPFRAYYRVASGRAPAAEAVTEPLIREAFGGTIYPPTEIVIEPLREEGQWWEQVVTDGEGDAEYLQPWRQMIGWFQAATELRGASFVTIGEDPLDEDMQNGGCVFPRMAVALTAAGSLVGIGGWVVHT